MVVKHSRLIPEARSEGGFSLIELLASVAIITILMGAVFQFLISNQQNYRRQQMLAEVGQGSRAGIEVMTMELEQAGRNPKFDQHNTFDNAASANGGIVLIRVDGPDTPDTRNIFYGSRLLLGSGLNQEEVVVLGDTSNSLDQDDVPAVLSADHVAGEPITSRAYPYPTGILYTAAAAGDDQTFPVNRIQFYGDINDTGDLWYAEYNLVCQDTGADACSASCPTDTYRITRFITQLVDGNGVFTIPASKAATGDPISPFVDNITGTCTALTLRDPAGVTPVFELNADVFGGGAILAALVKAVDITLNVRTFQPDPETQQFRVQQLRSHVVIKNVVDALSLSNNGLAFSLPQTPTDPTFATPRTLPLP